MKNYQGNIRKPPVLRRKLVNIMKKTVKRKRKAGPSQGRLGGQISYKIGFSSESKTAGLRCPASQEERGATALGKGG